MTITENGWVIINIGHPTTGKSYIVSNSFQYLRREAIRQFCAGTNSPWKYWRKEYNFRCVKAIQTIKTQEP